MDAFSFDVSAEEAGRRLDRVLVARVADMSRARARRLAAEGKVRVNGRRAPKGATVRAGDRVTLEELPADPRFAAAPDATLALPVLHEDELLVAVDKPAGAPSHPLRAEERGTVAGALLARYPEMAGVGYSPREPGIVHRLDTDTSGVMLAARTPESFAHLRAQLAAGTMDKRYLALCAGGVGAPAVVDTPLANHPTDRRRVVPCADPRDAERLGARPARTEILTAEPVGALSLVEVRASSATRHQVRAHLAALGHPLAGDRRYGGPAVPGLSRHFLHAVSVELTHPRGGHLRVSAPLPDDLREAIDRARSRD